MSKGKKIICALIATAVMIAVAFTLVACKDKTGTTTDYSATNGTYYRFSDGKANKAEFITLADGKWKDERNDEGTYEISGTEIKIFSEAFGEKAELYSGTIADGTLTLRLGGLERVYKRDVSEIPVEKGEKVAAPTLKVEDYATICWNKVAGAKGYKLTVDGREINVDSDKDSYVMENVAVGSHNAKIVALAETEDCNSDEAELNFNFDLYADGNGTEATPYGISTKEQFYNIKEFADKYFVIKKQNSFGGAVFDGDTVEINRKLTAEDGAVIDNVTIKKDLIKVNADAVADGLKFTNVINGGAAIVSSNKGTVRNLSVSGQYSGSISYPTAILINSNSGVAENCTVSGTAKGFFSAIVYNGLNGVIRNVTSDLTVEIKSERADRIAPSDMGFVCGGNYGTIASSVAIGSISFDVSYEGNVMGSYGLYTSIGTFVGENGGNISECYSKVNVKGSIYDKFDSVMIGGFAGSNDSEEAVISTSAYAGTFALTVYKNMGSLKIGGFIGTVNAGRVEHCLAADKITITCKKFESNFGWSASNCKYGGFAGRNIGAISDSYAGGLDISGAEGSTNAFGNMENNGSANGCFVSTDENLALDGDFWFVPRNGSPVLLALSDVKAIEGTCEITRNGNTISWEAVENADYYEYTVNDVRYYTQNTSATLSFTEKGDYTVTVRPCSDTRLPGEKTSISFSVRELAFKEEKSGQLERNNMYLADGYVYTVTALGSERTGYTFSYWVSGEDRYDIGDVITVSEDMTFAGQFTVNYYNVKAFTRVLDNETGKLAWKNIYDENLAYGTALNLPTPVIDGCDAAGYDFIGWGDSLGSWDAPSGVLQDDTVPAHDVTAYARFTMKVFKIRLYPNYAGNDDVTIVDTRYFTDVRISTFVKPTRRGYTFVGWYKEATLETAATDFRMAAQDEAFYAKWSLDTYTVTVELNGGTADGDIPSTYTVEDSACVLPDVTKKGYTFVGWTMNGNETSVDKIDPSEITGNITLTAQFTVNKYNLTFNTTSNNVRDGECKVKFVYGKPGTFGNIEKTVIVKKGEKVSAPEQSTYNQGLIRGWYTADKYYDYASDYEAGEYFDFNSTPIYDDITLYLRSAPLDYSVYNKYSNYSTTVSGGIGRDYGLITQGVNEKDLNTQRFRAKFINGSNPYGTVSGNFKIYVQTKDKDGEMDTQKMQYVYRFKISLTNLVTQKTHTVEIFGRYYNYPKRNTHYYILNYRDNAARNYITLDLLGAYSLEVECLKDDYIRNVTIVPLQPYTYDGYGEGELYAGNKEVTFDEKVGTLPTPSKFGYDFDGWYCGEDKITEDTVMSYDTDLALKAKFSVKKVPVEYVLDGGTNGDNPDYFTVDDGRKTLKDATKEGYNFLGWFKDSSFRTKIEYIDYKTYKEGITLYARFEEWHSLNFVLPDFAPTMSSAQISNGKTWYLPEQPAVDGYRAMGWYADAEYTKRVYKLDNPVGDVTIYGKYLVLYHIYLDAGIGTISPSTRDFVETDRVNVASFKPTAKNYVFLGWVKDGETEYVTEIPAGTTHDVYLTAVYLHATEGLVYKEYNDYCTVNFPKKPSLLGERDVVIPAVHNGKPVTTITYATDIAAKSDEFILNSITVSDGITTILGNAFSYYTAKYIYIPASVTKMEPRAVNGGAVYSDTDTMANNKTTVMYGGAEFPDTVNSAWLYSYSSTNYNSSKDRPNAVIMNVKSFEVRDDEVVAVFNDGTVGIITYTGSDEGAADLSGRTETVSYVDKWAFVGKTLNTVTIPAGITVSADSFHNTSVASIVALADAKISDGAFYNVTGLTAIDISNDVNVSAWFAKCSFEKSSIDYVNRATEITVQLPEFALAFKSLSLPEAVRIGSYAFDYAHNATSVTFSDNLTSIGERAFQYVNVSELSFGDKLETIAWGAFYGARSLETVTFPDSLKEIRGQAFYNAKKLNAVNFGNGALTIGKKAFALDYVISGNDHVAPENYLTSISLPLNLVEIAADAFEYRWAITDITMPVAAHEAVRNVVLPNVTTVKLIGESVGAYALKPTDTGTGKNFFGKLDGSLVFTIAASIKSIAENAFKDAQISGTIKFEEGSPITEISDFAFSYSGVKVIELPVGLKKIGSSAFSYCGLTSITIPDGMTVGGGAFSNCSLTTLAIGDNVQLDGSAFSGCFKLPSVVIGNNATIGKNTFRGCSALTSVTIGEKAYIYSEAFDGCSNLTSLSIGNNVEYVDGYAFNGCANLTYTVDGNAKYLGNEVNPYLILVAATDKTITECVINGNCEIILSYAFRNCEQLASVTIPEGIKRIESYAFYVCSALTAIELPSTLTNIGQYAFTSCKGLTDLVIPAGVSIGYYAFDSCSNLVSVTFGNDVEIGYRTFYACSGLTTITIGNGAIIANSAFYNCRNLTTVTFSDNVAKMGNEAFTGCESLTYNVYENCNYLGSEDNPYFALMSVVDTTVTDITIHEDCKIICDNVFIRCTNLAMLEVSENNECYTTVGGILYNKGKTEIIFVPKNVQGEVVIPDGVTVIKEPFGGRNLITSVVLPDSVTSIEATAFMGCRNLTSITFSANLTSIGNSAFRNCGFTTLVLPDSVTRIEANAFNFCSALTSITLGSGLTYIAINNGVFTDCSVLEAIVVSEDNAVYSSKDGIFYDKNKTTLLYVPNNKQGTLNILAETTDIGSVAMTYCTKLSAIEVSEDNAVYSSQGGILYNKQKTQIIRVPRKLQGEVTIADGVTSIAANTFYGCDEVTGITVPASVTQIVGYTFRSCSALTMVTMLGVKSLMKDAFYGCENLTEVIIPKTIEKIENYAFHNCSNLTTLTYEGSKSEWNKVTTGSDIGSFTIKYLNK